MNNTASNTIPIQYWTIGIAIQYQYQCNTRNFKPLILLFYLHFLPPEVQNPINLLFAQYSVFQLSEKVAIPIQYEPSTIVLHLAKSPPAVLTCFKKEDFESFPNYNTLWTNIHYTAHFYFCSSALLFLLLQHGGTVTSATLCQFW
jgi:hypothetical protein